LALIRDSQLRSLAYDTFGWCWDDRKYHALWSDRIRYSSSSRLRRNASCFLSPEDVDIQLHLAKYEVTDPSAVLAWCRVFSVPQPAKGTRRHICEPLVNDWFTSTPTVAFPSVAARQRVIAKYAGGFAVTLDFSSFFDQIPLSAAVSQFFGIRTSRGTCRMRVLPMGFRPSAAIGQCVTWAVCDLTVDELGGGTILSYIDNILVLAPTHADALRIARLVMARAHSIGAVFNEAEPTPSQRFTFLGATYDLASSIRTSQQSDKTLAKVEHVHSFLTTAPPKLACTRREIAALVGLFVFASSTCATQLPHFYHALKFYREVASISAHDNAWDDVISFPSQARASFQSWAADLLANKPLVLSAEKTRPPSDVLYVDASEAGWAAIHVRDSRIRVVAERWSAEDHRRWNLASSVASEPLAIRKALCRLVAPASSSSVTVYTDHQPVVYANASPCAKGYAYWRLQLFLLEFGVPVTIAHISGAANPADVFSRGCGVSALTDISWQACLTAALADHQSKGAPTAPNDYGEHGEKAWGANRA
jgi:hypothetical protein